jgi:flagellin
MLAIKNNLMAESAARQMNRNYGKLSTSVARLSSGQRIVGAKDDAAGLAVRELIRADIATLRQGSRNAQDAISMLQSAEGALSVVDDVLVRMQELAEQASTESYSDEQRGIMDEEFQQLISEIDRISANTEFNGLKLLEDDTGTLNIHLGSAETIDMAAEDMSASGLGIGGTKSNVTMLSAGQVSFITEQVGVGTGGDFMIEFSGTDAQTTIGVSITTEMCTLGSLVEAINSESRQTTGEEYDIASIVYDEDTKKYGIKLTALYGSDENSIRVSTDVGGVMATSMFADADVEDGTGSKISIDTATAAMGALNTVSEAIETKDSFRAKMGYLMNRLEAATSVNDIQSENLLAAESRISDVDVATEMAAMTRYQVLAQAGISMLGQANTMPQMALNLLQ